MNDLTQSSLSEGFGGVYYPAPASDYALFDVRSMVLATLIGTPVAGALLMAHNYRRLGQAGAAAVTVILGCVVTSLAILTGFNLPEMASYPLAAGLLLGSWVAVGNLQGTAIALHENEGGRLESRATAALVGVISLVVICLGVFGPVLYLSMGSKVVIGKRDEVFYTGAVTRQDAQQLGDALKVEGYFKDKGASVILSRETSAPGGFTVSMVEREGMWDQPGMPLSAEEVTRTAAPALGGFPLHVRLVDAYQHVRKQGIVGREAVGSDEVFYFGNATQADAATLGKALRDALYFSGRGSSVLLSKGEGPVLICFVVADGFWNDPKHVDAFETIVRKISLAIGGLPVTVRLVSTQLTTEREITVQ